MNATAHSKRADYSQLAAMRCRKLYHASEAGVPIGVGEGKPIETALEGRTRVSPLQLRRGATTGASISDEAHRHTPGERTKARQQRRIQLRLQPPREQQ